MSRRYRRHPLEVTADRLAGHYEQNYHKLSGRERDDISAVIFVLNEIAEGQR